MFDGTTRFCLRWNDFCELLRRAWATSSAHMVDLLRALTFLFSECFCHTDCASDLALQLVWVILWIWRSECLIILSPKSPSCPLVAALQAILIVLLWVWWRRHLCTLKFSYCNLSGNRWSKLVVVLHVFIVHLVQQESTHFFCRLRGMGRGQWYIRISCSCSHTSLLFGWIWPSRLVMRACQTFTGTFQLPYISSHRLKSELAWLIKSLM